MHQFIMEERVKTKWPKQDIDSTSLCLLINYSTVKASLKLT